MGKRIAIVTIYGIPNYGSVLQAYALQKYLQKHYWEYDIKLINYDYRGFIHRVKRIKETGLVNFLKNEIVLRLGIVPEERRIKLRKFQEFRKTYLDETKSYSNSLSLRISKEIREFDVFLSGSDQIWNTKELHGDLTFLLNFVPDNKKKVSFSSSFGIDYVGEVYKKSFKDLLNKYDTIGVRERKGITVLKELGVERPTCVTCDPTLLLESKDYNLLAEKSDIEITNSYILVYGLSYAFNPMPAILKVINLAVKQYKCKVIFLTKDAFLYNGEYNTILNAGPCDFIKFVANARYIVTSSFHGTMFSLIFRKPFTAVAPNSGDTRIYDILNDLKIGEILVDPNSSPTTLTENNIYTEDFDERIKQYINKSKSYLQEII